MNDEYANQLLQMQYALEQSILDMIQQFERSSGMRVHAIKVFPGEPIHGKRVCVNVEVAAQLR